MHVTTLDEKDPMLRITTQKKRGKTLLSIEGRLTGPLVGTLEQCWRELRAAAPTEKLHVDLCGVSFIDAAGKMLLKEIHRQGGELVAEGCLNQAIVDDIVKGEKETKGHGRKERPKGSHIVFYTLLFALLMSGVTVRAQARPTAVGSNVLAPGDRMPPPCPREYGAGNGSVGSALATADLARPGSGAAPCPGKGYQ